MKFRVLEENGFFYPQVKKFLSWYNLTEIRRFTSGYWFSADIFRHSCQTAIDDINNEIDKINKRRIKSKVVFKKEI